MTELLQCSAETVVGQTDLELAAQRSQSDERHTYWQQIAAAVGTVLQTGQAERRVHFVPTPAGIQPYETTYTPIRNDEDQLYQILSISRAASPLQPEETNLDNSFVGVEMPGLETASLADLPTAQAKADRLAQSASYRPTACEFSRLTPNATTPAHHMAEFMQIVLDSIPQYIFWKNREGVYLGSNHRWAEMAGLGDSSRVAGMTDSDLPWTQAQRDWYRQCDHKVMKTDTPMLRIKQSQRQADGQLSWRETSKFPLHDNTGEVVGLLGTIEDITERKISEDLLKQSEATFR